MLSVLCGWHQLSACHGLFKAFWGLQIQDERGEVWVGLCIKTGEICWCNGPYESGGWNDGMSFEDALVSMLEHVSIVKPGWPKKRVNVTFF
jgi:hypothetical protein